MIFEIERISSKTLNTDFHYLKFLFAPFDFAGARREFFAPAKWKQFDDIYTLLYISLKKKISYSKKMIFGLGGRDRKNHFFKKVEKQEEQK